MRSHFEIELFLLMHTFFLKLLNFKNFDAFNLISATTIIVCVK